MQPHAQSEAGAGSALLAFLRRHLFSVSLIGGVLLVTWVFLLRGFWVTIEFEAEDAGLLRVYWQEGDRGFRTGKENAFSYRGGANRVRVPIGSMGQGGRIRIDPLERSGFIRLRAIELSGPFVEAKRWTVEDPDFREAFRFEGDWKTVSTEEGEGLVLVSDGVDPRIVGEPVRWEWRIVEEPVLWLLLAFVAFVLFFERRFPRAADAFAGRLGFVPVCLLLSTGGSLAIAVGSIAGIHPDEFVHLAAGRFYEEHWTIPGPDDPAARASYSDYGVSRLNTEEVAYWVAGKFSALLGGLGLELDPLRFRLFNVFLLALITLFTAVSVRCRFLALPVLLTPQAWYLFGYFNSDAFALAMSFFFFFAVCGAASPIGRVFSAIRLQRVFLPVLIGTCLAVPLGLLKPNFWLLGGFAAGYLAVRTFFLPANRRLLPWVALGCMVAAPVAALFGWTAYAEWKAGFQREELMQEIRAETAKEIYNPNTPLEELAPGLYLRERGHPLSFLFTERRWHEIAFASSFGNYGYFGVRPTVLYYDRVLPLLGMFVFALFVPTIFRLRRKEALLMAGAVFSCAAVVAAAVYHSWVNDFQAQGRYLAPILPILGVLLYECRRRFVPALLGISVTALVLLALVSYWLIAVPGLT